VRRLQEEGAHAVDHTVETASGVDSPGGRGLDLGRAGGVERDREAPSLVGQRAQLLGIAGGEHEANPVSGQPAGKGGADTPRCSQDQHDALRFTHGVLPASLSGLKGTYGRGRPGVQVIEQFLSRKEGKRSL
jgi:hypothetical protein